MKNYKEFVTESENLSKLTHNQLEWCKAHIAGGWKVNSKGEVEVYKNLTFKSKHEIVEFPVQFADVKEDFDCSGCKNITSLKGSPRKVGGNCFIDSNSLKTLEGAPVKVKETFDCSTCQELTTLEGGPKEVGNFSCNGCIELKNLKGCPVKITGFLDTGNCKAMTTLEGAPKKLKGFFSCYNNENLISLKGAPEEVAEFDCRHCSKLTSFEGLPRKFSYLFTVSTDSLSELEQYFASNKYLHIRWSKSDKTWKEFLDTVVKNNFKGSKFGL